MEDARSFNQEGFENYSREELEELTRNSVDPRPLGPVRRRGMNSNRSYSDLVSKIKERTGKRETTYLLREEYEYRLSQKLKTMKSTPEKRSEEAIITAPEEKSQNSIPLGGDTQCPGCNSKKITASNVQDVASSIHYIDDRADFECHNCGNKWYGQYGYKGLA